jgi:hypothetical protein
MKKFILGVLVLCYTLPVLSFAQTNNSSRGKYGGNPIQILDNVVSDANKDYKIQQTALDGATDKQ